MFVYHPSSHRSRPVGTYIGLFDWKQLTHSESMQQQIPRPDGKGKTQLAQWVSNIST
ncbi:MAG: hypothetical protein AAF399_04750 [Bacteroidota bacterium]